MRPLLFVLAVLITVPALFAQAGRKPPLPPEGSKPLPPVLEPERGPVERRDLVQKFQPRHPIEGFYQLTQMTLADGQVIRGSRGYLVVGQRHMSLHLYAPGSKPRSANIQSAFRRYRITGDKLVMSTLLGHRNKANGDIGMEPVGFVTTHRYVLSGGTLRFYLGPSEFVEFERIE